MTDADGGLAEVTGFMVDVTRILRDDLQPAIDEALRGAMRTRGVIDQAKGALMLAYGLDAEGAFALLRGISTHHNIKLRDLAQDVVAGLPGADLPAGATGAVAALLRQVTRSGPPPGDRSPTVE